MNRNVDHNNDTARGSLVADPRPGRFQHNKLRQASFILPTTGERSRRNFTLREASHRFEGRQSETTPLLDGQVHYGDGSRLHKAVAPFREHWRSFWEFAQSPSGRGVFKCALAYFIGSLVTFVPVLASLVGSQQDSKHMVATVTVWFSPARTVGSMELALGLAFLGFLYFGAIGFTSMSVSMLFAGGGMLVAGHVIVLIVFVGGGLGFIAWTKQHYGDPLVNVACSLASLGSVMILLQEGSVQVGEFSMRKVNQMLIMVLMGMVIATAVNILILPATACHRFSSDLEKTTDHLGELLICITRAFLSGREDDLQDDYYKRLQKDHIQAQQKMVKDLNEARNEFLLTGKERLHQVSVKLVDCIHGLAQDLGGLRSSAFAQFALVKSTSGEDKQSGTSRPQPKKRPTWNTNAKYPTQNQGIPQQSILNVITEAPDEIDQTFWEPLGSPDASRTPNVVERENAGNSAISFAIASPDRKGSTGSIQTNAISPSEMFYTFLRQLGPPTKSLVYTLKQILDELPFHKTEHGPSSVYAWFGPGVEVAVNSTLRSSLKAAVDLYRESRKDALNKLYASRALSAAFLPQASKKPSAFARQRTNMQNQSEDAEVRAQTDQLTMNTDRPAEDVLADIEEVSAYCGHFSFSLLDFAEDVEDYLDLLDELKDALERPTVSWKWLRFWRKSKKDPQARKFHPGADHEHNDELDRSHSTPEPIHPVNTFADPKTANKDRPWYWWIYRSLRFFRRDDVKFAIKVGIGAVLYTLPAYISSTRPTFIKWRGEWGLISYMVVCCTTIGASNTTGINRILGTIIGAALAVVAWLISADHGDATPYLLAIFGFFVATGCHYLILAKEQGPMGRFILMTYNLGALYAYSLSVHDDDHDEDEGGTHPLIWDIVLHRLVAVVIGVIWGIIITRTIWPISARRKIKDGLCLLWLRMGLLWKRDPLALLLGDSEGQRTIHRYMDIREESQLQAFLTHLDSLRKDATSEFELRGPFPDANVAHILERTRRMLDAFHAINVTISKDLQCTPGEATILAFTRDQRAALSARISHLFSVLASSFKLEYPLNDVLPSIETSRDRLLARISEFRLTPEARDTAESDYELFYAYVLVTGQLAQDIMAVSAEIEVLFGTLNEENFYLQ